MLQLSVTEALPVRSGKTAAQNSFTDTVLAGAQLAKTGGVVSETVKVVVQVTVLPAASEAVRVTVVTPSGAAKPAAGDCVIELTAQLSAATALTVKSGRAVVQFAPAEPVWAAAQLVNVGAVVSTTVKVTRQVEVLPAASVAVIVTTLAPRVAVEPLAGDCVIVGETVQLSVATTVPVKSGSSAVQFEVAVPCWSAAHAVIVGAVVSATVSDVVQSAELPAASVTVSVTVVTPRPTDVPAMGDWTTEAMPQLSAAVIVPVKSGTNALQFDSAESDCAGAQAEIVGAVVSLTAKVTWCEVELPLPSATVIVTVVLPRPTAVPASGDCVTVTAVQLSVATTVEA